MRGAAGAEAQRRRVGDADRRQHGVEGDRVDRPAQRQVDRHQHHAQLVVGQHHAHRRRRAAARRRAPAASRCGRDTAMPAAAKRLLVDRRGDDRRGLAGPDPRDRCFDAARRGGAGARVDRRRSARRSGRPAGRRAAAPGMQSGGSAARVGERLDARHRQHAAGQAAAARRMTATSPTTTQPRCLRPSERSAATISGPMPQASPMVRTSGRRDDEAMRDCRRASPR